MKTGIQVSSFKAAAQTEEQVAHAFRKMQAMGCEYVQLQWIDKTVPIAHIARCLAQTGIQSVSVQDFYEIIREDPQYYIELNRATGGTWMCVSRIPERLKSPEGLVGFVEELRQFQRELDQHGQKLCFHPVSGDFAPIGGIDPVEWILETMPELAIASDLYHLNRCRDMICWLENYPGRVCMVHYKDENAAGDLVPPGQGIVDFRGVADVCRQIGVEYAFAEQERWEGDPFQRLKEGFDWVKMQ